jgi:hypothetical protein
MIESIMNWRLWRNITVLLAAVTRVHITDPLLLQLSNLCRDVCVMLADLCVSSG